MHHTWVILQSIAFIVVSLLMLVGGAHLWWMPFRRRK